MEQSRGSWACGPIVGVTLERRLGNGVESLIDWAGELLATQDAFVHTVVADRRDHSIKVVIAWINDDHSAHHQRWLRSDSIVPSPCLVRLSVPQAGLESWLKLVRLKRDSSRPGYRSLSRAT